MTPRPGEKKNRTSSPFDGWLGCRSLEAPVPASAERVGAVFLNLVSHPVETLLRRWNWKSVALSAMMRGTLFFVTNIVAGLRAALAAMTLEVAFLLVVVGFYGALTQAFRHVRPAWKATFAVMVLLPVVHHSIEFFLHWLGGTKELAASITASVCFSAVSAAFNLFAMRRGVLIIGPGRRSLAEDLRRMPGVALAFLAIGPKALWRLSVGHDR